MVPVSELAFWAPFVPLAGPASVAMGTTGLAVAGAAAAAGMGICVGGGIGGIDIPVRLGSGAGADRPAARVWGRAAKDKTHAIITFKLPYISSLRTDCCDILQTDYYDRSHKYLLCKWIVWKQVHEIFRIAYNTQTSRSNERYI